MRLISCLVWLGVLVAGLAQAAPTPAGWGLPDLMRELAAVHSASGNFTERRTLHLLDAPLLDSGTLRYVAPSYLRKQTLTPVAETFILDGDAATFTGPDGQAHGFSLRADPRIGGLVGGIRATLAGDLATLERVYSVGLSGDDAAWQLTLRPRDAGLARFVAWIVIRGSDARVTTIDTASFNGDHAEMGIAEVTNDAR